MKHTVEEQSVRWALDAFVVSGGLLFSYGWGAVEGDAPDQVVLELKHANGQTTRISAESGLSRNDVSACYPELPGHCGFLVYAAIPDVAIVAVTLLLAASYNDVPVRVLLPASCVPAIRQGGHEPVRKHAWATWQRLAGKAWLHLRQGNFGFVRDQVVRLLPKLMATTRPTGTLSTWVDDWPQDMALMIDHDLGGGANIFRDRLMARLQAEGRAVALLTFVPAVLGYHLKICRPSAPHEVRRVEADWWTALAACRKITTVYFNNCVSHPEPERMAAILLHFKRATAARLVMFMHDYHVICPSHFLLDDTQRYCGIPAIERCRVCLPDMKDNLAALYAARDIDGWRTAWLPTLMAADEVVCFAESGRDLLLRAYPALSAREIVIRPHEVPRVWGRYCYPESHSPLTIAVVGTINQHKGSEVVLALAREIESRGLTMRICVVGTLNAITHSKVISQTGSYRPTELPELLTRNAAHLALMPSIWPETFSFVTHELIALGVPLMSFELGAQGDATRHYQYGKVVPMLPAPELLDAIIGFKDALDQKMALRLA